MENKIVTPEMAEVKYLVNDSEIRALNTRDDLEEYIQFRKDHDLWVIPTVRECIAVGINSLTDINAVREKVSLTDDEVAKTISNENHFSLWLSSLFNGHLVYPIRYTGFLDVLARAGLNCRLMIQDEDKGDIEAMLVSRKAALISEGFSLNGQDCKVLIRDGKVSSMKSSRYEIFSEKDIVETTEDELKKVFPDLQYSSGVVSHEGIRLIYKLNATDEEEALVNLIGQYLSGSYTIKSYIQVCSSDVGNSSVSITPFIKINGVDSRLGSRIAMRHDIGNTLDDYRKILPQIAASLQEGEDQIELLGDTMLTNAADVFTDLCEQLHFSKKQYEVVQQSLVINKACTAMEVYLGINEVATKMMVDANISRVIELQEMVSKTIYADYKALDNKH